MPRTSLPKQLQFVFDFNQTSYRITCAVSAHSTRISAVVLLGIFQDEKMAQWVAKQCPAHTLVVPGAPGWLSAPDGEDTNDLIKKYTTQAIELAAEYFDAKHPLDIMAESQAAPGVMWYLARNRRRYKVRRTVLVQPLGFNSHAYLRKGTFDFEIFKKRIRENIRHQLTELAYDSKLRYNCWVVLQKMLQQSDEYQGQYAAGLMYNSLSDASRVARMSQLTIVSGARDMLFPPGEIIATLNRSKIRYQMTIESGAPHAPLHTMQGERLLKAAFDAR